MVSRERWVPNDHTNLRGLHALLSPSNYHWLNYDENKLRATMANRQAAQRGTDLHAWAHETIRLGIRQKRNSNHIYRYVNDGIGYRMTTDFMIFYTEHAFGEADTLSFREENGVMTLRIHDLKTGLTPASLTQLETYAAFWCLEYGYDPEDIVIIVQIYQNDDIIGGVAPTEKIRDIMTRTQERNRWASEFQKEVM